MSLDFKGFTEKEIQDIIDWKETCRNYDKQMWEINANEIIRKIIIETLEKQDKK